MTSHSLIGKTYTANSNRLAALILRESLLHEGRVTTSENKLLNKCYYTACHRDPEEAAVLITLPTPKGHESYGFHTTCIFDLLDDYAAQN